MYSTCIRHAAHPTVNQPTASAQQTLEASGPCRGQHRTREARNRASAAPLGRGLRKTHLEGSFLPSTVRSEREAPADLSHQALHLNEPPGVMWTECLKMLLCTRGSVHARRSSRHWRAINSIVTTVLNSPCCRTHLENKAAEAQGSHSLTRHSK